MLASPHSRRSPKVLPLGFVPNKQFFSLTVGHLVCLKTLPFEIVKYSQPHLDWQSRFLRSESSKLRAQKQFLFSQTHLVVESLHTRIFFERRDATEKNESPRNLHTRIYEKFLSHHEMQLGKNQLIWASSFELLLWRNLDCQSTWGWLQYF